jgi:hypothetical protein
MLLIWRETTLFIAQPKTRSGGWRRAETLEWETLSE